MGRRSATHPSHFRHPLNAILATEATVRVLRELVIQGEAVSVTVLMNRTGLSRVGVHGALKKLGAAGVIHPVGIGHAMLFQAAADHPLFPVLQSLYLAEHQRYHEVLEKVREIARALRPQPEALWLYGSVARGEDGVVSDFDLALVVADNDAVEAEAARFRELLRPVGEEQHVSFALIGLSLEDVDRLAGSRNSFWTSLASDARALHGWRPDDLAAERQRTGKR